jgi:apolipoprotein N-acyltransferase
MDETWAWVALGLAVPVMLVAGGRRTVAAAAWIGPALLLSFAHGTSTAIGLPIVGVALIVTSGIAWRSVVPLPPPAYAAFAVVSGLAGALPYVVDRLAAGHLPGASATLLFPATLVALERLNASTSPYGDWGSVAHSQVRSPSMLQLASLSPYAISFLVAWGASTLAWAWERDFAVDVIGAGLVAFGATISVAALAGGLRLAFARSAPSVRVAAIVEPELPGVSFGSIVGSFMSGVQTDGGAWDEIEQGAAGLRGGLLEATVRAAGAGARIVAWAEGAGIVPAAQELQFTEQAKAIALEQEIYLVAALLVLHRERGTFENKAIVIAPDGSIRHVYHKDRPVPGPELQHTERGDSTVRSVETPWGRLAVLVCFDADHPGRWREVARSGADLAVVPSSDWAAISAAHAEIAVTQAVRAGVCLLRPARYGRSVVSDAYGRVAGVLDHETTTDRVLISDVPLRRAPSLWRAVVAARA